MAFFRWAVGTTVLSLALLIVSVEAKRDLGERDVGYDYQVPPAFEVVAAKNRASINSQKAALHLAPDPLKEEAKPNQTPKTPPMLLEDSKARESYDSQEAKPVAKYQSGVSNLLVPVAALEQKSVAVDHSQTMREGHWLIKQLPRIVGAGDSNEKTLELPTMIDAAFLFGLLAALYVVGQLFEKISCPALVGEILVGMALGPGGFDIVPQWKGIALLGLLGILWLLLDAGIHMDLDVLREKGSKAFAVAFTGAVSPHIIGFCFMHRVFGSSEAFVINTALASTAAGGTIAVMKTNNMLNTELGQIIVAAAMINDMLSLAILAALSNSSKGWHMPPALSLAIPIASSIGFTCVFGLVAQNAPKYLSGLGLPKLVPLMMITSLIIAVACHFCASSPFLGLFLSGLVFSNVEVGGGQMARAWLEEDAIAALQGWLARIFFASVGFQVPVKDLMEPNAVGMSLVLSLNAVISKLVSGIWITGHEWTVGWAMVNRGGLALVVAQEAVNVGLVSKYGFNVTIWALLLSTLISPPIVVKMLRSQAPPDKWTASSACAGGTGTSTSPASSLPLSRSTSIY